MGRRIELPSDLAIIAQAQAGLITTAQCSELGVSLTRIARLLDSGAWSRVTRGVYDTDSTPIVTRHPDRRRRRAAFAAKLALGPDSVVVGACALAIHGVWGLPIALEPQAALPGGRRAYSRDGIHARMFDAGMTVTEVDGIMVATVDWALVQAVPEMGRYQAVAVMDHVLNRGLMTRDELDEVHDRARGRRGIATRHGFFGEVDARAESPPESEARLDCFDNGVPPDVLQVPVRDLSGVVRRGDLGWKFKDGRLLIAEIDSDEHHTMAQLAADAERHNDITAVSAVVLHFRKQAVSTPGTVSSKVRATLDTYNSGFR
ncbi:Transcriptional regulator, AbiEi antitoxin, Type IV TA system [Promicromonospora umidemergens]|uniref:AbiEi antitoxin N-terminal domain-containing protein n=1 Tax=Promicromonospora umidemergens TaxID=629679 RepID=A0ABP8YCQ8_9MICO|nr:type IV toxin-antitoxin system AbiEi family antitoxin domain-containing protein [Promicromonospora umidemergens]MCP2285796.1 Transcriptional regulator, AbiEi antitoxin, Type IV TA system [Promicromonospora umidemergens]